MIRPNASMSINTVTKMNTSAALRTGVTALLAFSTKFPLLITVAVDVDEAQELRAGARVLAKRAEHLARDHRHTAFVHAAGGHALVRCIDDDAHAARFQNVLYAMRDLCGEFFLHLEAPRVGVDHA